MTATTLIRDLMTVGVPTCTPDTPIDELARLMLAEDLEGFVVLDQKGHALGVVGRHELIQAYAHSKTDSDAQTLTAEAVMSEQVPELPPDIPAAAAAQIMIDQGIRVVFLMHRADGLNYPAAILSYKHLLRHLAAGDSTDLKDLGFNAEREPPLATFIRRRDAARRRASQSDANQQEGNSE